MPHVSRVLLSGDLHHVLFDAREILDEVQLFFDETIGPTRRFEIDMHDELGYLHNT